MGGAFRRRCAMGLALLGAVVFAGGAGVVAATVATAAAPTVKVAQATTFGNILTDGQGMTLYTYKKDTPGASACQGACASVWPPLTVATGRQPVAGAGATGTLGEIQRQDGTEQVTYNGLPLYRYAGDHKPGDLNGQGFANVWSVVPATTATAATSSASGKGW